MRNASQLKQERTVIEKQIGLEEDRKKADAEADVLQSVHTHGEPNYAFLSY